MVNELSLVDQNLNKQFFQSWLKRKNEIHPEDKEMAEVKPRAILNTMLQAEIKTNGVKMKVVEAIVGRMVTNALNGDRESINKIYNEFQHDGADQVHEVRHIKELTPAAKMILARRGLIQEADFVDVSDEATEPQGEPIAISPPEKRDGLPSAPESDLDMEAMMAEL